jgi:hypothetical protein
MDYILKLGQALPWHSLVAVFDAISYNEEPHQV